jgi:hypothetical protein
MWWESPRCAGMIIVHTSRELTCSDPSCDDISSDRPVLVSHQWFVSCSETLGAECPICAGAESQALALSP